MVDAFAAGKTVCFELEGTPVELAKDDVLTEPSQKPGFVAETDKGFTVVLDTNLTPALIAEGFAREVVSKLQTMRKEADFDVTDRIRVTYEAEEKLAAIIAANEESIASGVLALSLERGAAPAEAYQKEWNINGEKAVLSVRKA